MKISRYRPLVRGILCSMLVLLALAFTTIAGAAPRARAPDFAAVNKYVEQEMAALRLPGLALGIVQGDQIVHLKGFGNADAGGQRVTPQTPFVIESLSKSFTALAIMQLVEQSKLNLDAPVQRYLPWFRVADPDTSAHMTLRHLLHQTSGLPELTGNLYHVHPDLSDLGWMGLVSGVIALGWGILRAVLAFVVLRRRSAPKVAVAPAAA